MVARRQGLGRSLRTPRLSNRKEPGHAEMTGQDHAVVEIDDQIFGAPPDRHDAPPQHSLGEALGKGKAQVRPVLRYAGDARARHGIGESAAHGFDFGKFRHDAKASSPHAT